MIEDIKKVLDEYKEDTERHFDVIAEDLKGDIKMLSEQVGANTETLETIKLDIEFIKNDLKQKISRDEFAVLEKRVSLLEGKLHK